MSSDTTTPNINNRPDGLDGLEWPSNSNNSRDEGGGEGENVSTPMNQIKTIPLKAADDDHDHDEKRAKLKQSNSLMYPYRSTRSTAIGWDSSTNGEDDDDDDDIVREDDSRGLKRRIGQFQNDEECKSDVSSVSDDDDDDERRHENSKNEEVSKLRRFRNLAGAIVNNDHVQVGVVILIVINAIMMGVSTFAFVTDNPSVSNGFEVTDQIFLIIFTIELGFQFVYHGLKLFTDGWLVFDFFVILLSWSLASLRIVRTFRIFRALRLITRIKVLKNLVTALFAVGPRISVIAALLTLVMYIYAVMCTVLFKDLYERGVTDNDYFGRLDVTFWTLFVMITLDWANVARQVMAEHNWAWVVFVSFVMLTSFIVYNLIIAVVCDSLSMIESEDSEGDEEEEAEKQATEVANLEQTRELRQRMDTLAREQQETLHALSTILSTKYGVDNLVLTPWGVRDSSVDDNDDETKQCDDPSPPKETLDETDLQRQYSS